MTLIIRPQDLLTRPLVDYGGKAKGLAWLELHGFNVPSWCVICQKDLKLPLESIDLILESPQDRLEEKSQRIQAIWGDFDFEVNRPLFKSLEEEILDDGHWAVRSSASDEDGAKLSFAGIYESFLFVKRGKMLEKAIYDCFLSQFSYRSLKYREQNKLSLRSQGMGVIVQKMIKATKSGVAFSANPINGQRDEKFISSLWGMGEGLVSGECEPDEYIVDSSQNIHECLRKKDYYFDYNFETQQVEKILVEDAHQSVLDSHEIRLLEKEIEKIQNLTCHPQDIEWCFAGDKLYLLQTRPITKLPPPTKTQSRPTVFDNANIQESFCGVTTPLTLSYANEAYFRVYHQLLELVGLAQSELEKHENRHWNMLGFFQGRVYYNINSWYEGLKLLPSFQQNKQDMEKMMGLEHPVDFVTDHKLSLKEKCLRLPSLIKCFATLIYHFIRIDHTYQSFVDHFESEYKKFDRKNFHKKNLVELYRYTEKIVERITKYWQAPLINDFYVMTYNGKVRRWLDKCQVETPDILLNNLLSGDHELASTRPTKELLKLADSMREKPHLKEIFKCPSASESLLMAKTLDNTFYTDCLKYIELYGDRCIGELKLESITLHQDARFLLEVLQSYLEREDLTYQNFVNKEEEKRYRSETELLQELEKKGKGKVFKRIMKDVEKLRKGIRYREEMRLMRTLTFGLSRSLYREMGRQYALIGVLNEEEDVFYLTLDEIRRLIQGRCLTLNLKPLVQLRKEEYRQYLQEEPEDHLQYSGLVYYSKNDHVSEEAEACDTLKGTGCFPGIVTSDLRLIFDPRDCQNIEGKILCTVRTDPGWAPLFPSIKGLIVEKGSTLSHSAVVAREMEIPTIVGVPKVTKILKDKQKIKMDGGRGTITLV